MAAVIPSDTQNVGDTGHTTVVHRNIADVLGLLARVGAQFGGVVSSTNATNIAALQGLVSGAALGPGLQPSGDTSGATDTAAIQALINAAATTAADDSNRLSSTAAPVILGAGTFYLNAPLSPQQSRGFTLLGQGGQTRIKTSACGVFDFQGSGHLLEGLVEISRLTIDCTGGHVFTNINIHGLLSVHDLNITQRSTGYAIWYQDDAARVDGHTLSMYQAVFRNITYWLGTGTRSVEAWRISTGATDNVTDVTWEYVNGPNPPGYIDGSSDTDIDNTQYQYFVTCTAGSGAHVSNITWRNCLFQDAYGGLVKVGAGNGILVDGCDYINSYSQVVTNDAYTFISDPTGGSASRGVKVSNCRRSNALGSAGGNPPPYDVSFDSSAWSVTVENFTGPNVSGQGPYVNIASAHQALVIQNQSGSSSAPVISNQASDTIVVGQGAVSIGGVAALTGPPLTISAAGASGTFGSLASITNTTSSPANAPVGLFAHGNGERVLGIRVTGDTASRLNVFSDGTMNWGPGGAATADTRLQRTGTGTLNIDNSGASTSIVLKITASSSQSAATALSQLICNASADLAHAVRIGSDTTARFEYDSNGLIQWGPGGSSAVDLNLYRSAAALLKTDNSLEVGANLTVDGDLNAKTLRDSYLGLTGTLGETISRSGQMNSSQTLTSGTLLLGAVALPKGAVVGHLAWCSSSQAAVGPTHWWFGLYDSSLVQLAVTADQTSTAWAANTYKSLAVATIASGASATFTTTYTGPHYVGIMMAAGTPVNLIGTVQVNSTLILQTPVLEGTSDTSQTTPPSFSHTAAALTVANSTMAWGAVLT